MCDVVTVAAVVIGAAAGYAGSKNKSAGNVGEIVDPAQEQADAEAKATQAANAKIVERQRRRRSQNNLISTLGGPQDNLGEKANGAEGYTGLVGQPAPMGYVTAGRASAANVLGGGAGTGGGGGGGGTRNAQRLY